MDSADELKAKEFELKRIETVGKFIDTATERQFKLASFSLVGTLVLIAASSIAIKDLKPKLEDKTDVFFDRDVRVLDGRDCVYRQARPCIGCLRSFFLSRLVQPSRTEQQKKMLTKRSLAK